MAASIYDLYNELLHNIKVVPNFQNYYDVEFVQGFDMPMHQHRSIELMYVSKGKCTISIMEHSLTLSAGEFVLINGDIPHRLYVKRGRNCHVANMEFIFCPSDDVLCSISDLWTLSDEIRKFLSSDNEFFHLSDSETLYVTVWDILRELESDDASKNLLLPLMVLELMLKMSRIYCADQIADHSSANVYVNKSLDYMRRHYSEDISIDDIAVALSISTRYFQKIFKQAIGHTPMEHLNKLRIDKAKLLLRKTDIPLTDLCLMVGINSRQYFSYLFKKYTGLSPSEFRRKSNV
ncbi:helix-turn-helix domain-containing protein [Mahella sp.]|uniref:AraC family transcriptional regulator n=1 Tax=Mahella sp. TaxID=2798721 RepID=UPI0025C4CE50|nr:helix-turn-helix domain-containing protein [Mahella sp.]MBZ4665881.1 transcriptional regulator, AraC family [Mahella sp.]